MLRFLSKNENETIKLAEKIGKLIFPGAIILLSGDLGAGKTVFVRGLAKGLATRGFVKSPSYTIMNIYDGEVPLIHFDLYRLESADEFYEIGADEFIGGKNICAIEWHSNAQGAFGDDRLEVVIKDKGENTREITLNPTGTKHSAWIESYKNDING